MAAAASSSSSSSSSWKKPLFLYGECEVGVHAAEELPDEDATLGVACVPNNQSDPAVRISIDDDVNLGMTSK